MLATRHWARFLPLLIMASAGSLVATPSAPQATKAEQVRRAALTTWIHGMTDEIAETEVGVDGLPYLIDLLKEPEFPRRDNVVAFLAYLGGEETPQHIAAYLKSVAPEPPQQPGNS